jgi:hypothetical protein
VTATEDEKRRTAEKLRDLALKYKFDVGIGGSHPKAPPGTRIVPLPSKPFIDFVDYEHALRSPSFIHDRNHDGECFICDNYYELRRATMLKEAGTDL